MLKLRDMMTPDPLTVGPESTLRDVVEILSANRISGVPVITDAGHVVGVLSASDILAFTATEPGVPVHRSEQTEWGEITDEEEDEDDESENSFFADYWVDAGADVVTRIDEPDSPEWDLLDEHTAGELMTRKLHAMEPDASAVDAARHMADAGIHRLLVIERGRLVGVVSAMDFVRAVARARVPV